VLPCDVHDFEVVILKFSCHLAILPVSFLGSFQYIRFLWSILMIKGFSVHIRWALQFSMDLMTTKNSFS